MAAGVAAARWRGPRAEGARSSASSRTSLPTRRQTRGETAFDAVVKRSAGASEWLMAGYPADLDDTLSDNLMSLKVGDTIRMGVSSTGFSDYLTIMERVEVATLSNMIL